MRYIVCFIKPLFKIHSFFGSILTIFLLIRVFFVVIFASAPLQAQGGFFSFILGDDVYADTMITPVDPNQPNQTLGNMALLQANVSPDSILEDKTSKKDDVINPNASINIVSDNALLSATGPMGVFDGEDGVDPSYLDTSVYVVRPGDTIGQIAQMYGVSVNTILWANDMKKEDKLVPGDVLFILPIDGREHTVASGQTLQSIAKLYKADIKDIIEINNIAGDARLAVGDKLLIPGGNMADEGGDKPARRSRCCGCVPSDRPRMAEASGRGSACICAEDRALDRALLHSTWSGGNGPSSRSPNGLTLIGAAPQIGYRPQLRRARFWGNSGHTRAGSQLLSAARHNRHVMTDRADGSRRLHQLEHTDPRHPGIRPFAARSGQSGIRMIPSSGRRHDAQRAGPQPRQGRARAA